MVGAKGVEQEEGYVELQMHTNYSLLEGASHPEELIKRAVELGYRALAITDRNNLYGALGFAQACNEAGIQPIIGVDLTIGQDGGRPHGDQPQRSRIVAQGFSPFRPGVASASGDLERAVLPIVEGGAVREEETRENDQPKRAKALGYGMERGATKAGGDAPRSRLTLLAISRQGYANLCRLASMASGHGIADLAERERRRLDPCLPIEKLAGYTPGLLCLTGGRDGEIARRLDAGDPVGAERVLWHWIELFGAPNVYVQLHDNLVQGDQPRNHALVALARSVGVGVVATGDVWYHDRARHRLHDTLLAIKHRSTLEESHILRRPNSEFFLRSPAEQAERFAAWPEAVRATVEIAKRCAFDLTVDLGYRLPTPPVPARQTPDSWLAQLCWKALLSKYREEERADAEARLEEELALIARHGLAGFFLVYHEVLQLALSVAAEVRGDAPRSRSGLPPGRGRGSSVGSIVCYLIGLSHIDPIRNRLFLGRFLNEDMTSLPDIDLDFPRDIRDRLFQRVYQKWGIDHAALVAIFPRYRARSAIRDLGKALGLPAGELDRLAKTVDGYASARDLHDQMLDVPQFQPLVEAPGWRELTELAREVDDFPRHVSQHVGGVVIASEPLVDCVPISPAAWPDRYVCHWDKDAIEDAGMVKIDFLALGMLSLVEECLDLCAQHRGEIIDLSRIDFDDERVYDRIGRGDTVGVFQIESRAQAGTLPRTRPRNLDDLTAQVAIIRPGPIVGGSVHAYVQRREGGEATIPHECLRPVLEETLGVVLFQEQVTQVAMAMGGFTAGEAEAFRRAMGRRRGLELAEQYKGKFMAGARERDVPAETAEGVWQQLLGFAEFGFPKSHASAFALLAYQSAWLKEYYTPEFFCALYNNWPMGFYPPHVFTNDARRHGVSVLGPDINRSAAVCTVENGAVRIGLGYIEQLGAKRAEAIVAERAQRSFRSLWDFTRRTGVPDKAVENAIHVGAFDGFGMGRRELLWQLGLFGGTRARNQLDIPTEQDELKLPDLSPYERMVADYAVLGLSPQAHPMRFLRAGLGIRSCRYLRGLRERTMVEVAGLVVCRQRPGTAKGIVFLLLEDEDGMVNVLVVPQLYDRLRVLIRTQPLLRIRGVLEGQQGDVPTIRAHTIRPLPVPQAMQMPEGKNWG